MDFCDWLTGPNCKAVTSDPALPPRVWSVYAHHLQLFSHVLPIGSQLKLYLYKLRTGGMQKQCTFTVHSEDCVSCLMMHGLMYRMFLDKLKKKSPYVFFNQSVKSVKILMMPGMPFCFYVLDFRHLYTSAMITWVKFILIDKEAVCNKN